MRFTNENLGHGTPARQVHHAIALFGRKVYAHLLNVLDAARFEELFGTIAIRANGGGVHLDGGHGAVRVLGFF
jgi:hypothetical protein